MDRQVAERLMASALALDPVLGEIDSAISAIFDEAERREFAKSLGEVFRLVNEGFINPIGREHLELAERD